MEIESLAEALEREHREIDAGIAVFTAASGDRQPLARAIRALRRHIYLEEEFLFPLLREAEPGLAAPASSCCVSIGLRAVDMAPGAGAGINASLGHDCPTRSCRGEAEVRRCWILDGTGRGAG